MAAQRANPNAEVMGRQAAIFMNVNAAKGLYDVLRTNLGPRGTIKMLVGGAGDVKLTKDGNGACFFAFLLFFSLFFSFACVSCVSCACAFACSRAFVLRVFLRCFP